MEEASLRITVCQSCSQGRAVEPGTSVQVSTTPHRATADEGVDFADIDPRFSLSSLNEAVMPWLTQPLLLLAFWNCYC